MMKTPFENYCMYLPNTGHCMLRKNTVHSMYIDHRPLSFSSITKLLGLTLSISTNLSYLSSTPTPLLKEREVSFSPSYKTITRQGNASSKTSSRQSHCHRSTTDQAPNTQNDSLTPCTHSKEVEGQILCFFGVACASIHADEARTFYSICNVNVRQMAMYCFVYINFKKTFKK